MTSSGAPRSPRGRACEQPIRAGASASAARERAEDRLLRADIGRLRGRIEVNLGSASDAHRIFTRAARAARPVAADDPTRALEMAVAAGVLSLYDADGGSPLDPTAIPMDVAPADPPRTRCSTLLLASTTAANRADWASALGSLRAALHTGTEVSDPDVPANLGNTALRLGDDDPHRRCCTPTLSGARDAGAAVSVLYALPRLVFTQVVTGQWPAASSSASEAQLVGTGMSNKEVAARCWISPPHRCVPPPELLHRDRRHVTRRARTARPRVVRNRQRRHAPRTWLCAVEWRVPWYGR